VLHSIPIPPEILEPSKRGTQQNDDSSELLSVLKEGGDSRLTSCNSANGFKNGAITLILCNQLYFPKKNVEIG
jgi:hypothetical protein